MNQQTIDAVNKAVGRTLSDKELIGVQSRIEAAFHDLEAEDPAAWHALPDEERASRASELATTRHKAAVLKEQQQTIGALAERFGPAPRSSSEIARADITSSALLNGHVV